MRGSCLRLLVVALACASVLPAQFLTDVRPPGATPDASWTRGIRVAEHLVETQIEDGLASTKLTLVFRNSHRRDVEGTFLLPLPKDVVVKDFALEMGGKMMKGEVLERDRAAAIYTGIVQRAQDPALLEFMGSRLFKARVFPIPAMGTAKIELTYGEVLLAHDHTYELRHPFRSSAVTRMPVEKARVDISIKSKQKVLTVYSPSHEVKVVKNGDHEAKVSYAANGDPGNRDFALIFGLRAEGAIGATLLTHEEKKDEGAFLLLLAPSMERTGERLAKDVVFVVDTSGSMAGRKIEQTKGALHYCVSNLAPEDRFNVIHFSTDVRSLSPTLMDVNEANRTQALDFVKGLEARGGTNIHDALLTALNQGRDGDRPLMVIFLTDGTPTVGQVNRNAILAGVRKANQALVRLFVFGVGNNLNVELLDLLAEDNHGARDYVGEQEDIEVKISSLFSKVSEPVLADLSLGIEGLKVDAVHPKELTDLFRGDQLMVTGRYKGSGPVVVKLKGKVNGKEKEFVFEPKLTTKNDERSSYVPRLWAARRVGYLMDQVRLHGSNQELVNEVVRLGKSYGVVTPYTSYLVVEDEPVASGGVRRWGGERRRGRTRDRQGATGLGRDNNGPGLPAGSTLLPESVEFRPGGTNDYRIDPNLPPPLGGGGGAVTGGRGGGNPSGPGGQPDTGGGLQGANPALAERARGVPAGSPQPQNQSNLPIIDRLVLPPVAGVTVTTATPQPDEEADFEESLGKDKPSGSKSKRATKPMDRAKEELQREDAQRSMRGQFFGTQIKLSQTLRHLRESRRSGSGPADGLVKRIGNATFFRRPGLWIDAATLQLPEAAFGEKLERFEAFSKEWTALLAKHPETAKILALGDSVLFMLGDRLIQVLPQGALKPAATPESAEQKKPEQPAANPAPKAPGAPEKKDK